MSDKQINQLLDRVAKLEAEVSQLKVAGNCGGGWEGVIGSQKDNPFFLEVIAEIENERADDRALLESNPTKKRVTRRNATVKK